MNKSIFLASLLVSHNTGSPCCAHTYMTFLTSLSLQVHEASMMAVSFIVEDVKLGRAQLDCQSFTEKVILPDLSADNGRSPLTTVGSPLTMDIGRTP